MTSKTYNLHLPTLEQLAAYDAQVQLELATRPYHTGARYGQWLADQKKLRQSRS